MAHSHGKWASYWQEASVAFHVGLSRGLLECPHDVVADFLQINYPKEQDENCWALYELALEITRCHFHNTLVVTTVSPVHGGRSEQGHEQEGMDQGYHG